MVIILCGKSAAGKDRICNELVKRGYPKIITYTSRPMRKNEIQDQTYHFISKEEFEQLINAGFFAEWRSYDSVDGKWYYGSSIDSYDTDKDSVIILNPEGFYQIKKYLNTDVIMSFYIYSNLETIKKRLNKRGGNKEEAARRITADLVDFKGFENEVDKVIYNNDGTDINEVVDRILSYVNTRKVNRE